MRMKKYAAYAMAGTGTALLALGVQNFLEPSGLVAGGISGLGMIADDWSRRLDGPGIPLWLVNLALNLPLFLLAWYQKGIGFVKKTIGTSLSFSLMLYVVSHLPMYAGDMFTAAAYGGMLAGAGLGLVLRCGATTGGVDLAAALLHDRKLNHIAIPRLVFALDTTIILLGMLTFGVTHTLYAILAVFLMEKVMHRIAEGSGDLRAAVIRSEQADAIRAEILDKIDSSNVSFFQKETWDTKKQEWIFCIFSQKELPAVKQIVINIDSHAFFLCAQIQEVMEEKDSCR